MRKLWLLLFCSISISCEISQAKFPDKDNYNNGGGDLALQKKKSRRMIEK